MPEVHTIIILAMSILKETVLIIIIHWTQIALLQKFLDARHASLGTQNPPQEYGSAADDDWNSALRVHIYQPPTSTKSGLPGDGGDVAGGCRQRVDWCLHLKVSSDSKFVSGENGSVMS